MIKYNNNKFVAGEVQFRVHSRFSASVIPTQFMQIPYKVVYVHGDVDPLHIFNCSMNVLGTLVSISNIYPIPSIGKTLTNSEIRYLLGKTVDEAESLAKSLDKVKVVVSSTINTIVDVFVEKDFIYRKKHNILGYKGIKRF